MIWSMPFEHLVRPAMQERPSGSERTVVLCIEDDAAQRVYLTEHLEAAGYDVITAADGAAASAVLRDTVPHVILLDLGLPDIDGVELCRRLVEWPGSPVLVVSADRLEERMVAALDSGARDYVTKPFSPAVLAARLRGALRDHAPARRTLTGDVLALGDVVVDVGAAELRVDGETVPLHARPFAVLEQLLRHEGVLLPYAVLLGKRRGDPVTESEAQALRVVVSRIRKALGTGPRRPAVLTESRVGYRLAAPES